MISLTEMHRHRLADFLRVSRWLITMNAWTFVTGPAVFFVLLFIIGTRPNIGDSILGQAEHRLRGAPAGQVWGGKSPARHVTTPVLLPCEKQSESREAWISEANVSLHEVYIIGMCVSIIAGLYLWRFKQHSINQAAEHE